MASPPSEPATQVAVFGPSPLLTISIEGPDASGDEIGLAVGGQGPWVAASAATAGTHPVLCALSGDGIEAVLEVLLVEQRCDARLVPTAGCVGRWVVDRRDGRDETLAYRWAGPPTPEEVEDLLAVTATVARDSGALVVCNPMPGDLLPVEVYARVVADARALGTPVVVDLSSPRLDSALAAKPDVVKINDWELAEFAIGPIQGPGDRMAAAERIRTRGARSVVVTSGPGVVLAVAEDGTCSEIIPPSMDTGDPAGCGDAMTGAMAAALARGVPWLDAVVLGVAAGAAHFAGCGRRQPTWDDVEALAAGIRCRPGEA
jgi:fructose-1-phosphate kinase PfkB-like protein